MFTQPVSSPPPVGPGAPLTANNTSSTTSRRLRGLSYLRNYTHNHLLSREHNSHHTNTSTNNHGQSSSVPAPSSQQASASRSDSIVHSFGHSPTSPPPFPGAEVESSAAHTAADNYFSAPFSSSPGAVGPRLDTILDEPPAYSPGVPAGNTMNGTGLPETGSPPETTPPQAAPTGAAGSSTSPSEPLPSIRFSAYFDPRATRPSLSFSPIARTLPTGTEQIRVGRYSERDAQPNVPSNVPSSSPVGFKSKVVSRRHCEFWYEGGKWYIKDVKSSSGTFLNHIRLSPPGTESKPFPVNDGDIVQLGIDFKGGEEMIFRCVKMRLELNRGWQNKPNAFNVTTHKRLRIMASAGGDSANSSSQDCSICLNSIAPCQSLFVAPCSHTWHYKCIRSLLNNPQYPIFVCPNCRMAADLEADIEDPEEDWDQVDMDEPVKAEDNADSTPQVDNPPPAPPVPTAPLAPPAPPAPPAPTQPLPRTRDSSGSRSSRDDSDAAREVRRQSSAARLAHMTLIPHSVSQPLAIRPLSMLPRHRSRSNSSTRGRTPSPPTQNGGVEGPITPRNDAGPWVFDGSAAGSRAGSASEGTGMRSLDEAAEGESER